MTMQPDVIVSDVPFEELNSIEKRIRELELVRATKIRGTWLYEMDTTVIERLRAERDGLLDAIGECCA